MDSPEVGGHRPFVSTVQCHSHTAKCKSHTSTWVKVRPVAGMGIPHLTSILRPCASPATFSPSAKSSDDQACQLELPNSSADLRPKLSSNRTAIIDGPALAYFAYSRAQAVRAAAARNAFEAVPDYAEVGQEALAVVDQLESSGFYM